MDTVNPPPADSIIAADAFYGWLEREALRAENDKLREEIAALTAIGGQDER